ncbi:AAA-like domain-containing protein [Aerosakkonemataceae cyanobacterium BLCC-F154]|uniref:AAA-like domain-containing protein n=1 Tax=Floridaenema fluviatile BLCC-F154 TaxID=3153640 RepID=A0ABV4Y7F2_9CYAN
MDVEQALEFVDKLVYDDAGKYLSDLERKVFIGSWQGLTYEKIHPEHREYVEKDVAFRLWKKLSKVLGEEVKKKNLQGAITRAYKARNSPSEDNSFVARIGTSKSFFISYHHQQPDASLVRDLERSIAELGGQSYKFPLNFNNAVALNSDSYQAEADWFAEINQKLQQSDYFLLLLSPESAVSEMVIEILRRVRELRDRQQNNQLTLLTIRVNCPTNTILNHDLRGYLEEVRQREWNSPADTPCLLEEINSLFSGKTVKWENSPSLSNYKVTPGIPLPVAEPEIPSGQVRLASAFYVERVPCENQCYSAISQPGALIRVKAPRQMGKTSLMARVLYHAEEKLSYRTVPLSFQLADTEVFTDLNQLLRWFCAIISRKLGLASQLDKFWTDTYGSKDNCTIYFEDYLLPAANSALVLGLDEVDRVFQYPKIADDFFGLLRAWFEEAGYGSGDSNLWGKLRLVVVHSTEVYIPLNVNQSPFNVGLPIELPEFNFEQVQVLIERHQLNWQTSKIEQLMALVGGHPYLIRLALYRIAQQEITLEKLLETAPTEAGLYNDHLRRHLWSLQQHPELADAFAQVVTADTPIELESVPAFKLHSMGLVKFQGNQVIPRFNLYRIYFRDRL